MPSEEPKPPKPHLTIGDVLFNRWFWVNYAATLLLTCWIPLLTIEVQQVITRAPMDMGNTAAVNIRPHMPEGAATAPEEAPEDGPMVRADTRNVRIYQAYAKAAGYLWDGKFASRGLRIYLATAGLHLALCFAISFWVWYAVLRTRKENR